jgi:L-2-hydroxyglutarate oxidase
LDSDTIYDIAIIGGGIVGAATALKLAYGCADGAASTAAAHSASTGPASGSPTAAVPGIAAPTPAAARLRLIVLEAERRVAAHQTGHNSGVIHSGLYYKPGSLKALGCVRGREEMFDFCAAHGIPHDRCGKVVVALDAADLPRLEELARRGRANGLRGVRRLSATELREREPAVAGIAGLWVPETGIVDYTRVLEKYL